MSCNIQILISNWLRTRKFSHFLQARKAVAFGFSHHVHELVTLWLVKIWQVIWLGKFVHHLETYLGPVQVGPVQTSHHSYSTRISEKNSSLRKRFLVECLRSTRKTRALQAASAFERPEFWRETHTLLWPLIGRIIFLTREKTSFAILIGRIIFFTCEKHRSLLWLARTHLRMKI